MTNVGRLEQNGRRRLNSSERGSTAFVEVNAGNASLNVTCNSAGTYTASFGIAVGPA